MMGEMRRDKNKPFEKQKSKFDSKRREKLFEGAILMQANF